MFGFASCSDSDDDDDSTGGDPETPPLFESVEYNFVGLSGTDFNPAVTLASGTTSLSGDVVVSGATLHSPSSRLRVRAGEDSLSTAINYNSGESADIASGVTVDSLSRYISVPVADGASKVTVSYKAVTSSSGSTNCQIGLFGANGAVLGAVESVDTTFATVSAATTAYLVFSRNGAGGGGIDVYSIKVE